MRHNQRFLFQVFACLCLTFTVERLGVISAQQGMGPGPGVKAYGSACAFPCSNVIDNFNRADEAPATGWTDTWEPGSVGWGVFSNTARTASNANGTAYRTTTDFGPDVEVYATLATIDSYQQLAARLVSEGTSGLDGYLLSYAGSSFEVYVITNNSFSNIPACNQSVSLSNGDAIGMSVIGTTITTYTCASGAGCGVSGAGWTQRDSCTDATHSAAGKVGVRAGGQSTRIDDFGAGTR